jgi:hypothetical protein
MTPFIASVPKSWESDSNLPAEADFTQFSNERFPNSFAPIESYANFGCETLGRTFGVAAEAFKRGPADALSAIGSTFDGAYLARPPSHRLFRPVFQPKV